jgi:PBSX family phage terminase large subunit
MIKLSKKQTLAFDVLTEPEYSQVTELLFGGGAGGGKSALGCIWLMHQCLQFPNTRWVMGRNTLHTLKETTLNSFFEVARLAGLQYKYIENKGIMFPNGSQILLKDLAYYPSDPDFNELGSLEITGAFVDECNQITEKGWNILMSRIRYKLDENGLTPKILGTCNPARNWVYDRFYKPFKDDELSSDKMFIQSLVDDNPHISIHYKQNLDRLDEMSRERLKKGNWDFLDISGNWAHSYRPELHLGDVALNRSEVVHLAFDFNRNPIACHVSQHYGNHYYGLEQIEIDNCTTYQLCNEIRARYPGCFFMITGDVSGKAATTVSRLHNFDIIKYALGLKEAQMQYSGANPPLAESRMLVNAMLERYPMTFDKVKCAPLIRDLETVKSDNEGRPIKTNRKNIEERADCLDTFRYTLHRWFGDFLKILAI